MLKIMITDVLWFMELKVITSGYLTLYNVDKGLIEIEMLSK